MDAHLEVMESLRWAFEACGIPCSVRINELDLTRRNIVFGWIVAAQINQLADLPDGSILYNFEQFAGHAAPDPLTAQWLRRFQVWDYSPFNMDYWRAAQLPREPFCAPVSYAPTLTRIPRTESPDIDTLFIGAAGMVRYEKLLAIASSEWRPSMAVLLNVWGEQRDALIGRARLMLNVSSESEALRIFEVTRVSYYLANRIPVLCERVAGVHVEPDLQDAVAWAHKDDLAATCERLLADPSALQTLGQRGFDVFSRRDARQVVRDWLAREGG
ncbi:glycosyltransferase [Roseateles cellulosilyticus]|uniref:Glycosyltransferase n=1 Tax=Pelomonas cellulosilytica TaxID=2906762 RepID=A0ABS8XWM2_9BURK|nr:glycosyltransferase [Pelomonas sp. P8]MCE4556100.1 glycosyltransferase [Pelomonas sp. P8]